MKFRFLMICLFLCLWLIVPTLTQAKLSHGVLPMPGTGATLTGELISEIAWHPSHQVAPLNPKITASNIFTSTVFLPLVVAGGVRCDLEITPDISKVDARTHSPRIEPGSTICIIGGRRGDLKLANFEGTADQPFIITNYDGQVIIDSKTTHGILIQNSRHFRLTGSGARGVEYGIKIISSTNAGLDIGFKSTNFEVDHLEISGSYRGAIYAKTEPVCSDGSTNDYDYDGDGKVKGDLDDVVHRDNFTQYDTIIHDNYIHDVGTEGLYIGSSSFRGTQVECQSGTEKAYPSALKRVNIYSNVVERSGWDGIQVGSIPEDCSIHHNQVYWDSQANTPQQQSGIMNNSGSACNIYSNLIQDGGGSGIFIQGHGGNRVYNNVIVRPGRNKIDGDGITVFTGSNPGHGIYIWNNTIVQPPSYGIAFENRASTDNQIKNNIIANPGLFNTYGGDAFIKIRGETQVTISNNLKKQTVNDAQFVDPHLDNYSLKTSSPAVDGGHNLTAEGVTVDFLGTHRPQGSAFDIGAFEIKK